MLMQALKTFRRSDTGEIVKTGHEFDVGQMLARTYENQGMARALGVPASFGRTSTQNKAAQSGPLASAGGETGAAKSPPSSPVAQVPETRRSTSLSDEPVSSSSIVHGNSSQALTSSTAATAPGGKGRVASRRSVD